MTDRSIFLDALDIPDPVDRAAFLDRACGGDRDLRWKVEQLLAAHGEAGSFLDPPAPIATAAHDPGTADVSLADTNRTRSLPDPNRTSAHEPAGPGPTDAPAPDLIAGRYRVVRPLGEGGMGSVYLAEQVHPVRREVALKLIRPGMDSARVVARFEAERQALAVMDHPSIARVYDAGSTGRGQPFFVMELVHGEPLTDYCDRHRLTVRDRLGLFAQVCAAVQHAHQKGVIHRDLKPGNVLVAELDGKPVPKVIDFGLAKALEAGVLPDVTGEAGASVMGTPLYMAPEQAAGGPDIDTRADVYALGVILYELLVGSTPLDRAAIRGVPFSEVLRQIQEVEPPAPTARFDSSADLPAVAAARGTDPNRLRKLLRGDLEWVARKCLEKDRTRRYDTANAVALEVQRYLANEPVSVGPPSRWYKARKFVRRNRGPILAASLVFVALVGGVIGTSVGLSRAEQGRVEAETAWAAESARAEAEREAKEEERKAKELALRQLGQIRRGTDALALVFNDLDLRKLEKAGDRLEVVLGARLKAVVAGLTAESVGDPLVVAELQNTLGLALLGLGHIPEAIAAFEEARATRSRLLGPDHPDTLTSTDNLAAAYREAGKLDRAISLHEEVLALSRARLGPDHPHTLTSMSSLAVACRAAGKLDRALSLSEEVLALTRAKFDPDHPLTLISMNHLAGAYHAAGKLDKAFPLHEELVALTKAKLGPDHPDTLASINDLAVAYTAAGKPDKAMPLKEELFTLTKAKLGPDHPHTLIGMNNLADSLREVGNLGRALPLLQELVALTKAKLGPDHPLTLSGMNNLAAGYDAAGKRDEGLALHEEVFARRKATLGPDHPDTLTSMSNVADGYRAGGKLDKAIPLHEETLALSRAGLGPGHPITLAVMNNLAVAYRAAGKPDRALSLHEEVFARRKATLGPDHPSTLTSMNNLASAYHGAGKLDKALPLHEEALELKKAKFGPDHPDTLLSMNNLAATFRLVGRLDRAVPLFEQVLRLREKKLGRDHSDTHLAAANLGVTYKDAGRLAEAIPLLEEAYRASRTEAQLRGAADHLMDAYLRAGKTAEAAALVKEQLASARPGLPKESPQLAGALAQAGSYLLDLRAWDDAEAVLRECLTIREKAQPDVWTTFNTRSVLGGALLGRGRYADAEPLLLAGYEGMKVREKTIPPPGLVRLPEAADRLVELYAAWGKPAEAAKWRAERAKYPFVAPPPRPAPAK